MELQLGLALPPLVITTKATLLDLNSFSSHFDDIEEHSDASTEGYGSSISTHGSHYSSFDDATNTFPQTLPLLWNKQPRQEEETEGIVGWPPIKTCQKRHCDGGRKGGFYVKAQMEGVVITRKIDLSPHQSYHSLLSILLFMFGKDQESGDEYTLTYQDMEGDWLLASDVPWRVFVESVQRLKLLRN